MHPVIRLTSFLCFAAALAWGGETLLWAAIVVLAILLWHLRERVEWLRLYQMIRRLRFLLLSLMVLYLWFTPGDTVWPALGRWSPTDAGMALALHRAAVLVLMVAAAHMLLRTTATGELIAALAWLGRPLRGLGFSAERFGLRLTLTLASMVEVQTLVREARPRLAPGPRLQRLAALGAEVFAAVERRARDHVLTPVEVPESTSPPFWQWWLPATMVAVAVASRWL